MPSAIMAFAEGSQSTELVSCLFMSATMSFGSVPGWTGSALAFIHTVCFGGFMDGSSASSAAPSLSAAGCMSEVWKAPEVFTNFAESAPASSANAFSVVTASAVPAQEKPAGKSTLAMTQTAPGPSRFAASAHRPSTFSFGRPATDSISCLLTEAASCIASPRSFTSDRPSSKVNTPAAHRAVYSPRDKPAMHCARVTASSRSMRSFSRAARPATNITGWQFFVSASRSSGPLRHSSSTSQPRTAFALASNSRTGGRSFTPSNIFRYCEPWPGKSSPMESGGSRRSS
mmetsp:Transcript_89560/g.252406  ORF Transcript_89560/g.252406 Transcript_89560/m.252406 type:complete len:287 (+) Transcript_89560:200-1060(+)